MRTDHPDVTVIIVTYESRDVITAALDCLRPSHESGLAECIVVDNASKDDTAALVAARHPWAKLISGQENLGYGRGCNLGFEEVQTPYVLFMNPDVLVDQAALGELVRFAHEHPLAGLVGPAIDGGNGQYQHADAMVTPGVLVRAAVGLRAAPHRVFSPGCPPFTTSWICGAIMLGRTDVIRDLGAFDPRFFLYFEETDLCRRVSMAGYEIWACPSAVARHSGGASARVVRPELPAWGCLTEHFYPSRFYYLSKHFGALSAVCVDLTELFLYGLKDLLRFLAGRSKRRRFSTRIRSPFLSSPPRRGDRA